MLGRIWDLPRIEPVSCVGRQILNNWITREILVKIFEQENDLVAF